MHGRAVCVFQGLLRKVVALYQTFVSSSKVGCLHCSVVSWCITVCFLYPTNCQPLTCVRKMKGVHSRCQGNEASPVFQAWVLVSCSSYQEHLLSERKVACCFNTLKWLWKAYWMLTQICPLCTCLCIYPERSDLFPACIQWSPKELKPADSGNGLARLIFFFLPRRSCVIIVVLLISLNVHICSAVRMLCPEYTCKQSKPYVIKWPLYGWQAEWLPSPPPSLHCCLWFLHRKFPWENCRKPTHINF